MTATDPRSAYSARALRLFGRYTEWYFKRHFNALRVANSGLPGDYPAGTVLYANHPSWWDPIVLLLFAGRCFEHKRVFAPIDAVALERYAVLGRLGLFPISRGPTAGREFIFQCERILEGHDSLLAITAQGRFSDPRERPMHLRRGLAHLLCGRPERQAVPVALEYVFWNERMPEVLVRFGEPIRALPNEARTTLHHRLEQGLRQSVDALSVSTTSRDAEAFDTLIESRRQGVGGIYGQLQRWRAKLSGREFSAAHRSLED